MKSFNLKKITKNLGTGTGFQFILINPSRDWFVGLCGTTLLFILSIGYVGHTFLTEIENDAFEVRADNIEAVSYRASLIANVLEEYRGREERFNTLKGERVVPQAPAVVPDEEDLAEEPPDLVE